MITPEWITAIGTAGTFVVISASALAALKQLSHMRGSNQIIALTECRETLESPEFRAAQHFVSFELPERLKNPNEARKIGILPFVGEYQAIGTVANFFESMGLFVKSGIIDETIACDFWAFVVLRNWNALAPITTYIRRTLSNALWENFEYMAVLSQKFSDQNPDGAYPRGVPRMPQDSSLYDLMKS
jgi:uncharacterized protein DUF4760